MGGYGDHRVTWDRDTCTQGPLGCWGQHVRTPGSVTTRLQGLGDTGAGVQDLTLCWHVASPHLLVTLSQIVPPLLVTPSPHDPLPGDPFPLVTSCFWRSTPWCSHPPLIPLPLQKVAGAMFSPWTWPLMATGASFSLRRCQTQYGSPGATGTCTGSYSSATAGGQRGGPAYSWVAG